jgi:hypothetical protein
LRVALAAPADVARIDSELSQSLRTVRMRLQQLVAVEVEIAALPPMVTAPILTPTVFLRDCMTIFYLAREVRHTRTRFGRQNGIMQV